MSSWFSSASSLPHIIFPPFEASLSWVCSKEVSSPRFGFSIYIFSYSLSNVFPLLLLPYIHSVVQCNANTQIHKYTNTYSVHFQRLQRLSHCCCHMYTFAISVYNTMRYQYSSLYFCLYFKCNHLVHWDNETRPCVMVRKMAKLCGIICVFAGIRSFAWNFIFETLVWSLDIEILWHKELFFELLDNNGSTSSVVAAGGGNLPSFCNLCFLSLFDTKRKNLNGKL